jgi:hypothetical protein
MAAKTTHKTSLDLTVDEEFVSVLASYLSKNKDASVQRIAIQNCTADILQALEGYSGVIEAHIAAALGIPEDPSVVNEALWQFVCCASALKSLRLEMFPIIQTWPKSASQIESLKLVGCEIPQDQEFFQSLAKGSDVLCFNHNDSAFHIVVLYCLFNCFL